MADGSKDKTLPFPVDSGSILDVAKITLHLELTDSRAVRDLARTISQLKRLTSSRIKMRPNNAFTRLSIETIFFYCSVSLIYLELAPKIFKSQQPVQSLDPVAVDWDYLRGPLALRKGPLVRLKSLAVPAVAHRDLVAVLKLMIQHCPSLESLQLPHLGTLAKTVKSFIELVGRLCPLLSNVSKVIQAALTTCAALEILKVTTNPDGSGNLTDVCLSFEDAIEHDWVCKEIKELEMAVGITTDGHGPKYLVDQSKNTWTEDNHRHWVDLGKLYTQLGALTQLEVLDLKGTRQTNINMFTGSIRTYTPQHRHICLPSLLVLENSARGQIGYLTKLAGLTNLRQLQGSLLWTNAEVDTRIGQAEMD
ncbi:hypothetical protein BGW39_002509, partial [Mortierella sp. 14UC]